jgi:hypothetical protein
VDKDHCFKMLYSYTEHAHRQRHQMDTAAEPDWLWVRLAKRLQVLLGHLPLIRRFQMKPNIVHAIASLFTGGQPSCDGIVSLLYGLRTHVPLGLLRAMMSRHSAAIRKNDPASETMMISNLNLL